jgi:hypothetical protein
VGRRPELGWLAAACWRQFTSSPAAVSWGANRLDVFGVGLDGGMYHNLWDGKAWGGWQSLGGTFTSSPAAVSWGVNRLDVFDVGLDGAMYHNLWDGKAWGGWQSLGGTFVSPPASVSWGPNRLDVFGIGDNNRMFQNIWDGGPKWSGWASLPPAVVGVPTSGWFASAPAVTSQKPGVLDVFGVASDGSMLHLSYVGVWGGCGRTLAASG